jgi:hypothetical protein
MMRIAILVLAALLSVILVEGGVVAWLNMAGADIDLTGHFFLLAVTPVVLLVTLVIGLLFSRVFAFRPKVYGTLYLLSWLVLHAGVLKLMGNPTMDIAWYLDTIVVVAGLVLVLLYFTRWRVAETLIP